MVRTMMMVVDGAVDCDGDGDGGSGDGGDDDSDGSLESKAVVYILGIVAVPSDSTSPLSALTLRQCQHGMPCRYPRLACCQ